MAQSNNKAEIYPVLHTSGNVAGNIEQAHVAFDNDSDGLFLIDHHNTNPQKLLEIYESIRTEFPDRFIGLNLLSCHRVSASLKKVVENRILPDGLWSDSSDDPDMTKDRAYGKNIKIFGGIAFKYTTSYTDDPETAARLANAAPDWIDVITTSGPQTGQPASLEKLKAMHDALPEGKELAVASGVDMDNIEEIRKVVDKILLASSIEQSDGIFDAAKLREITEASHQ